MVAFNRTAACGNAELYYYDYLCGAREAAIPPAMVEHLERCAYCQGQIRQLEAALAGGQENDRQYRPDAHVADVLSRHFSHVGDDLTCAKAKPFLPALLIPSLEIRIPTPITVHVNHCGPCSKDLEALRGLKLRPEQLARLSRLYGDRPDRDPELCRRTRSKIDAITMTSLGDVESEVLDHMCTCRRCRALAYRRRERLASNRQSTSTDTSDDCPGISMADLFDYGVPYGRSMPGTPRATAEEKAIASHVEACRGCAGKMQALHRTIYGVAERADSGVSTIYTTGGAAGERVDHTEHLYEDYPISVNVVHRGRRLAVRRLRPVARIEAAIQRVAVHPQFKPVWKVTLLTAAMIPLAVVFLISSQTASGINARQISNSIKSIENLHITEYVRDSIEPVQELWIAQDRGLVLRRNARERVLYDLNRHRMTISQVRQGTVEDVLLTAEERERIQEMVDDIPGFRTTGIPVDKEFERLTSDGDEVYELIWVESSSSSDVASEYRVTVVLDALTKLPRKIETFRRRLDGQPWRLTSKKVFAYPSRQIISSTVEEMFPSGRSFRAPERTAVPVVLVNSFDE